MNWKDMNAAQRAQFDADFDALMGVEAETEAEAAARRKADAVRFTDDLVSNLKKIMGGRA